MSELPILRPAPVQPGDVLAGKYEVEQVLGSGGMGVVVAARHLELDERVAVKFLLPEAIESPEAAARFVREARAAVKIKSEHVARVIDVGRLESGAPYMVMEYLRGRDLAHVIPDGQLPIESAVDYVVQACDAMADAHALGIVHRDLKPANLFLTERSDGTPVVKVLDFGISKVSVPELKDASLTRTSTAMGSPLYMSPEQMRSAKDVDPRTDIWGLGAILYELLTGSTPFRALSYPELCAKIMSERPAPLRELRADVPAELEAIILRCLEKSPQDRFSNVAELAAALAPFAPRRARAMIERIGRVLTRAGISASDLELPQSLAAPAATEPPPPEAGTKTSWVDTGAPGPRRSRALLAIGIGAALVLIGAVAIGAITLLGQRPEPEVATPSPLEPSVATVVEPASPPPSAPSVPATVSVVPVAPSVAPARATAAKPTAPRPSPAPASAAPAPAKPIPPPAPKPTTKNPLDIGLK